VRLFIFFVFQTLQQELQECVSSVKHMNETTQSVMNDIDSGHQQQLILQTITRLLSRLQSVENDAAQREKTLIKRTEDLTTYQVCLLNCYCLCYYFF